jgi:phage terminase large subunit-like protein
MARSDPNWSKPGRKPPVLLGGELYLPPDLVGGDRVVYFFERYLTHVKGELAGTPLALDPWQKRDILLPLFSVRKDGLRKYRTCYVEVPRKNTKSTLGSGIALYMLLADHEPGAEIVSAAADRDQARIVFDIARSMVEASEELKRLCTIYRYEIVVPATGSRYRAISAEAYSKHGMNLHAAIIDEVHAHPNRELYDVLSMSMGSRRQPLTFAITTAGYDRTETSLCWALHEHALRVRAGLKVDPSFLGVIYAAPEGADWKDPAVWALANPGLGTSIKREYLEQECRRAQDMPVYQNEFRRFHLNQWTASDREWVPMDTWDCGNAPLDLEALKGRPCYGGLDMSTNTDLSALVLVFPQPEGVGYDVLAYAWCPETGIRRRSQRDHAPYDLWARDRHLLVTAGDAVDQEAIRQKILELRALYDIREIGYDDWNMGYLAPKLMADGLTLVPLRQTFKALSGATKHLERCVLKGELRHGGHPVLRWCIANTVVDTDGPENVKPSKKRSPERIDLTVALVMALERVLRNDQPAWTGAALVL